MAGLFGDWHKIRNFTNPVIMKEILDAEFSSASRKSAQLVRRNIVLGIRNQRKEWKPLAPSTLARKSPKTKILIDTGEMMRSISVIEINPTLHFIGIPKGKSNRKKKGRPSVKIVEYARVHEFGEATREGGGAKVVKRPFINPGFEESLGDIVGNYNRAAQLAVVRLTR